MSVDRGDAPLDAVTEIVVDITALQHNLKRIRHHAPHSRVLAIVKNRAYGHGLLQVARALESADALGVFDFREAKLLRREGITQPIVILSDVLTVQNLHWAAQHGVHVVVYRQDQLDRLCATRLSVPIVVWLKFDTGMHRLGFSIDHMSEVVRRVQRCPWVDPAIKLMTHLSSSQDVGDARTLQQIDCFVRQTEEFQLERSVANSAAVLAWPQTHFDWVRPGRMLYGTSPFAGRDGSEHGLRPVMRFCSYLLDVAQRRRGDVLGYGTNAVCPKDMLVGIVAVGYGSGYPFSATPGTPMLIQGVRCPLVGEVCMNMLMVDISAVPLSAPGDRVVLWGEELPVEHIAQCSGTIPSDVLCRVEESRITLQHPTDDAELEARTRWRCRTGMRELDVLLLPFLEEGGYAQFSAQEKVLFEQWLQVGDQNLLSWLVRGEAVPERWRAIVEKILLHTAFLGLPRPSLRATCPPKL